MRTLLVAGLVAGTLVTAAPVTAHATHADFRDGCFTKGLRQNDATGSQWYSDVEAVIVASGSGPDRVPDPTLSITDVSCELVINDVPQYTVLTAPDGTGITANVGEFEYSALSTDVIALCAHATIDGEPLTRCSTLESTEIPPQPIVDAVVALLNEHVFEPLDPAICGALVALAPTVAGLGRPDLVHIEPEYGDTSVLGGLFWDCPPYGT